MTFRGCVSQQTLRTRHLHGFTEWLFFSPQRSKNHFLNFLDRVSTTTVYIYRPPHHDAAQDFRNETGHPSNPSSFDMQSSSLSVSSECEMSSELTDDFRAMLTLAESKNDTQMSETAKMEKQDTEQEEREGEEEKEEFSFVCLNPIGFESVVSADEAFQDGQIRPIFPVFDQSLLFSDSGDEKWGEQRGSSISFRSPVRKVFVAEKGYSSSGSEWDELEGSQEGEYCKWSGKSVVEVKPSRETCKKSYSTGFSKLWRFSDLVHRSKSDGKDAFVFLNSSTPSREDGGEKPNKVTVKNNRDDGTRKTVKVVRKKTTTSSRKSAHEKLYVGNKAKKEGEKRRSYLPYKQELVRFGFFTNVNSLSRNVHPY